MPVLDYEDAEHDSRRALRSDLLDKLDKEASSAPLPHSFKEKGSCVIEQEGVVALERAIEQWRLNIVEPRKKVTEGVILEDYIHRGLSWYWIDSYTNRKFAWCGAFMAFCWITIKEDIRKKSFASTYRLRKWASGSDRIVNGLDKAQAGDIIVVGHKKAWGDHITLFERKDGDGYWSVEGNAYGETPTNERQEGVIRRWRRAEEIHSIYRPLECDKA